jgi:hypothetical protein
LADEKSVMEKFLMDMALIDEHRERAAILTIAFNNRIALY